MKKRTEEIIYKVTERHILNVGEKGWNLELRKISWNDSDEKWDLRKWFDLSEGEKRDKEIENEKEMVAGELEKMSKGVVLTDEEFLSIAQFFQSIELEIEEEEEENENPENDEE